MCVRISVVAGLVSAVLLAACSSDGDSPSDSSGNNRGGERKLRVLGNGDEFLAAVREGLISQNSDGYASTENMTNIPPSSVEADSTTTSDGNSSAAAQNEVTSTNTQEQGVDEQDWVKVSSAGDRLYVLDSNAGVYNGGGIVPLDESGVAIEPAPREVGVGGKTTLRILQLDADTPDASSLKDLPIPSLDGRYAEGFYLYEKDGQTQAILSASGNNFWGYWSEGMHFGGQDSIITKVDVTDAANASVSGSLTIDGQIVSSRRIGQYLFLASRFYPKISGVEPYQLNAEQWQAAVSAASAEELLPQYSVDDSATRMPLIDPASCFVAEKTGSGNYYSPDIITLSVFDLDTWKLSDSECYLGASETLYASPEAVYLATTRYDYSGGPISEDGVTLSINDDEFPADIGWYDPRVDTDIHQFDIESGQQVYAGSGVVKGHLGWNPLRKPFRMSEKDGFLRVATFNDQQGPNESPILLSVLQANGSGELATVSTLPNASEPGFIGKPGEQLYASRFLGDRAYLVTFRETDPLYIIDLKNPLAPSIAGELQIDGYSDYLHPIDENYLLGIGKDAVATPGGEGGDGRGALVQGVKLSLFNVSNPAAPTEIQSVLVGQRGTESRALNDHRAITVQVATEQHPTRVSFGIDVNGQASPDSSPSGDAASNYLPWSYTGLHGFEIRTGADAGITSRGVLKIASAGDNGYYYPSYSEDRSVMVNDSVFYIKGSQVYAAPWDDLANPTPAR